MKENTLKRLYITFVVGGLVTLVYLLLVSDIVKRLEIVFMPNILVVLCIAIVIFFLVNFVLYKQRSSNILESDKYYFIVDTLLFTSNLIGIMFLFTTFIVSQGRVSGSSMDDTLEDGDLLIYSPLFYKLERFDIILIESDELIVKRLIGLPGEKVEYFESKLYVNGVYIEERFNIGSQLNYFTTCAMEGSEDSCIIPDGMYLAIGDNRNNSYDSRDEGYYERSQIIGEVIFAI